MTNYTTTGQRKIEIPVGISYADDVMKTTEVLCEVLKEQDFVIRKDDVSVYAVSFGDSSVNLLVWFWIDYPGEIGFMDARHKGVHLVHQTLAKNDILIPFPIRTLDFDAKGGQKLNTMLSHKDEENSSNDESKNKDSTSDANSNDKSKDAPDGEQ